MPRPKGLPKTGGRGKGASNKITADVKALAQEYGAQAIKTLANLMMKAENESVRLSAADKLLDRGFGKAIQQVAGMGENGEHIVDASITVTFKRPDGSPIS